MCHIFFPFLTVHGVLKARILKWFSIPFSSGPHFVKTFQPSHPLSSLLLPSIFLSIRVFSNESALCIRWPKYWSFSFNISPSNEHPGLISFRMDWLDLLEVQRDSQESFPTSSSKASILWCSDFFIVRPLYPYLTTGKTIALIRWTLLTK